MSVITPIHHLKEKLVSLSRELASPLAGRLFVPSPYMLIFVLTHRCNSRCGMCNLWQSDGAGDLTVTQIAQVLRGDWTHGLRIITLTGGEPTLRADLPDILAVVLENSPAVETLVLATNALAPKRVIAQLRNCLETTRKRAARLKYFFVQLSLDGIGAVHDHVRGVSGAFAHLEETVTAIQELRGEYPFLRGHFSTVAQPANIHQLAALHDFAAACDFDIHFSPVIFSPEYFGNAEDTGLRLDEEQHAELIAFFRKLAVSGRPDLRAHYRDVTEMLANNKERARRCMMGYYGITIEHNGDVYPCVNCERVSFGNLLENSLEEIWRGERANAVRAEYQEHCCRGCTAVCYTQPVGLLEVLETAIARRYRNK